MAASARVLPARSVGELAQSALRGDAGSWTALALQLRPWALAAARQRLANKQSAEDAVQESFLIAFHKIKSLRNPEAFQAWLAAILHSRCAKLNAEQSCPHALELPVDQVEALEQLTSRQAVESVDPADALQAKRLLRAAVAAAHHLPAHLREVAEDYFFKGLTTLEISFKRELLEGTVKKRLHAARNLLAAALAPLTPYEGEKRLRVGFMPISDHLLGMVAQRLETQRDGPVSLKRFLTWSSLSEALRRGQIDAAFIMAPLAMRMAMDGVALTHIMDAHHDGSSLSVAQDRRVARLALPAACSTHALLLDLLGGGRPALQGLSTSVVSPSYVIGSMRKGQIDSFFCAEPWGLKSSLERVGKILVFSKDILPGHTCCILAVRKEIAASHGELLAGYVRRLLKARDRIQKDADFGARVQAACTGVDKDIAQDVLQRRVVTFDDLAPCKERLAPFLPLLEREGKASFDLDGFLCADFLV